MSIYTDGLKIKLNFLIIYNSGAKIAGDKLPTGKKF
jgi:hypothetical protein